MIKLFLGYYSTRPDHVQTLCGDGAMRINLDGIEIEPISETERLMAQTRTRKLIVEKNKLKGTAVDTKTLLTEKIVANRTDEIKLPVNIKGKQKSVFGTRIIVKPKRKMSLKEI